MNHSTEPASAWVQRWSHLVKPGGTVLDVACGTGRHAKWFANQNHAVVGVDRCRSAIESIASSLPSGMFESVVADIENGPWPLPGRQFDAVVVTNYLWRPLWPTLLASLNPGGVLFYETFAQGNETLGKPSRPDFLLRSGELFAVCNVLQVVAFEDGFEGALKTPSGIKSARFVQRIAAVHAPSGAGNTASPPPRYALI